MSEKDIKVQSVDKAVRVLDVLAEAGKPLSLGEIAQRTEIPKSTLHGLISTLRELRLVAQSQADGKYSLGLHLFELGCAVSGGRDVIALSRPYLQGIAQRVGETTFLATYDGEETIILDAIEALNPLRIAVATGSRLPLYCTSQGKLFLAHHDALQRRLRGRELAAYTPHSIIQHEALQGEYDKILRQGYSVEDGEYRIGLRAVSAPVFGADGTLQYAVGVVGMFRRVQSEEFQTAIRLVTEAAHSITEELQRRSRL